MCRRKALLPIRRNNIGCASRFAETHIKERVFSEVVSGENNVNGLTRFYGLQAESYFLYQWAAVCLAGPGDSVNDQTPVRRIGQFFWSHERGKLENVSGTDTPTDKACSIHRAAITGLNKKGTGAFIKKGRCSA